MRERQGRLGGANRACSSSFAESGTCQMPIYHRSICDGYLQVGKESPLCAPGALFEHFGLGRDKPGQVLQPHSVHRPGLLQPPNRP